MFQGEPDVVEPFDKAYAVGGRHLEGKLGAARCDDALRDQIDSEWGGTIDGHDARFEPCTS